MALLDWSDVKATLRKLKPILKEDVKKEIINDLNIRVGGDINNLDNAYEIDKELVCKRNKLQAILHTASDDVPTKRFSVIAKAELNSKQIDNIREKREALNKKVEIFLTKTEPLMKQLDKRFSDMHRLEEVLNYFKSFAQIEQLSNQMKQCKDDEQLVNCYGEMKKMCNQYQKAHRGAYVKEYTHYWHNVLKDKLTKNYEEVLKLLKWPFTSAPENSPPPKEVMNKFNNLTTYLFLIQEPKDVVTNSLTGNQDIDPCLPVKTLLRPLKKRFAFHFTGSRQTARIDRPEWFLTQTLTWIKDHQAFIKSNVQPIADKLQMKNVNAVEEFNAGLIALAAERLHTVLAIYHTQGSKGELVDVDAAFAHAVDETLGFHRELTLIKGTEVNSVISVLTKAETFVKWLAVEKKYALAKMDQTLANEQWIEPVAAGLGSAVGSVLWVPRGADWFIALLKTIEDRYAMLPQPGHRLQFLELQLELIEEWRIRLTQLLSATAPTLLSESFLVLGPHPLIAIINAAYYTRTVLLQWVHSLHYLQLHYYRRQFQHFTQQQHQSSDTSSSSEEDDSDDTTKQKYKEAEEESISLNGVEVTATKLALNKVTQNAPEELDSSEYDITPLANLAITDPLSDEDTEDGAVFGDAPALLAHLRDAGMASLAEHILLEFKATIRDYKTQKWHSMLIIEEVALSVSGALCGPLSSMCARIASVSVNLAPRLAAQLRALLATNVDDYLFEEVVLQSWFNTGGTIQLTHDVKRNIIPAFAQPNTQATQLNPVPKLLEACTLLNLDYEDARRLRTQLIKEPKEGIDTLNSINVKYLEVVQVLQILNQRTDLRDAGSPSSVMELF